MATSNADIEGQNRAAKSQSEKTPQHDKIRDNAPRIVGAVKFLPDILLFLSGLKDTGKAYFRSAAAISFMASRSILLINGTKNRKVDHEPEPEVAHDPSFIGTLKHNVHKVMHPHRYPVESGAGVAAIAGVAVMLSGAAMMRLHKTGRKYWEGFVELCVGIITTLAEGNVLFSKEKTVEKSAEKNPEHKKASGIIQKLKDQPVLLSGITQAIASSLQIALGFMIFFRGNKESERKRWQYLAAASIYTGADLVYAFLVRKNEFNGEHQKETQTTPLPQTSAPQMSSPIPVIHRAERTGIVKETAISVASNPTLA